MSSFDYKSVKIESTVSGLLGGSIGVMGTLYVYESKRYHRMMRVQCAYCIGSGYLDCAKCVGVGDAVALADSSLRPCLCDACSGYGRLPCINCKGEGTAIPLDFTRKEWKGADLELEQVLDEMGIAAFAYDSKANEIKIRSEARNSAREEAIAAARAGGKGEEGEGGQKPSRMPRFSRSGTRKQSPTE